MFTKENGIMLAVVVIGVLLALFIASLIGVEEQADKLAAKIKGETV